MCRGRRSRPITPASATAGPMPGTCMHIHAQAGGRGACTCMHARGRGPAVAEAGVIGRDWRPRQTCFVQG
eukprot:228077-Chlamydomonas_euryale.AAC.3